MGSKPREVWVDALRGVAILAVVWFHTMVFARTEEVYAPILEFVFRFWSPFRIPVLMMVSGMMVRYSLHRPVGQFVRGKLETIAWPLLVWSLIDMVVQALLGRPGWSYSVVDGIVEWITPSNFQWYIAYLFLFSVIARLLPRALLVYVALASWVVAAIFWELDMYAWGAIASDSGAGIVRFAFLLGFFLVGDMLAGLWREHRALLDSALVRTLGGIAALFPLALSMAGDFLPYDWHWLVSTLGAILVLRPMMESAVRHRWSAPLSYVGRNGMTFYLSSYGSLAIGQALINQWVPTMNASWRFTVLFALALLVGTLLARMRSTRLGDALFLSPSAPRSKLRVRR